MAKEKAELQTELRALRLKGEPQTESDENEDADSVEQFMNSCSEQPHKNGAEDSEEEEEVIEQKVQNSDGNSDIVDLSKGKPPPKPPRLKIEEEAEEHVDEYNNNESEVAERKTEVKVERKEDERHVNQNGDDEEGASEDDWEIVGRTRKTAYSREKTKDGDKENKDYQSRVENKDPNRPRYTKAEMLEILIERNNLKEQVFALQDELKIYKPG